jgi:hypothetical protein
LIALGESTLSALTLLALALAVAALVIAAGQGQRLRSLRRSYSARRRAIDAPGAGASNGPESGDVEVALSELREAVVQSIRHVGLVRFDAFEDMGGKLSFAVALLDEEGSGVVFSSINGRNETRVYAKPVERGASRIHLADEEVEAIRRALAGVRA